jgi:hypothetical protein
LTVRKPAIISMAGEEAALDHDVAMASRKAE